MNEGFRELLPQAEARVRRTLRDEWTLGKPIAVGGADAVYAATHRNRMPSNSKVFSITEAAAFLAPVMLHAKRVDPQLLERTIRTMVGDKMSRVAGGGGK